MKKILVFIQLAFVSGAYLCGQPALQLTNFFNTSIPIQIFEDNGGYDLIGLFASSGVVNCQLDPNFDSLFARPSIIEFFPTQVIPAFDSGYIVVGPRRVGQLWASGAAQLSPSGFTLWTNTSAYQSNGGYARAIQPTPDSMYLVAGRHVSTQYNALFSKIDQTGNIVWEKLIANVSDVSSLTGFSGHYMATVSTLEFGKALLKISLQGDSMGIYTITSVPLDEVFQTVRMGNDRLAVLTLSRIQGLNIAPRIVCMDTLGQVLWDIRLDQHYAGLNNPIDNPKLMEKAGSGEVFVMSQLSVEVDSIGSRQSQLRMVRVDSTGNVKWAYTFPNSEALTPADILPLADGRMVVLTQESSVPPNTHLFVFGPDSTTRLDTRVAELGLRITPQPAQGMASAAWDKPFAGTTQLTVYDLQGREVRAFVAPAGITRYDLPLTGIAGGMYLLRVTQGGKTQAVKLMIR